jgi:hypothetical protein
VTTHKAVWGVVVGLLVLAPVAAWTQEASGDLETTLARVGAQLERYFQQSQRIVSTETVSVRSFDRSMRLAALPRQLVYERRVEWDADVDGIPSVTVVRELISVNGRAPGPRDENPCLAPDTEVADPLSVLLPARQREFKFSLDKLERIDGRAVAHLVFTPIEAEDGEVVWEGDCIQINLPGWYGGEAWVDVETGDVLRLDEHLTRRFEFREPQDRPQASVQWLTLERDDTTIRYERVRFENPAETLMLPRSIERSWASEGSGIVPRYFRSERFSDYRRFVTEGRLVGAPTSVDEVGAP